MKFLKLTLFLGLMLLCSNILSAQCPGTPPLDFTFESTESRCQSSGTITLHITGGAPFVDGGGNPIYNNTIIAPTVIPVGGQADTLFSALAANTYTVEVADANGCTVSKQVTVPGTYMTLELIPRFTDATCDGLGGGIICGVPDEGLPWPAGNYEYELYDGSTNPPTLLVARGLDSCFTNLAEGSYQIRAYDSCENFQTRDVLLGKKDYASSPIITDQIRWNLCDTSCVILYPRTSGGNPFGEYPFTWEIYESSEPSLVGQTGIFDANFERDTLCYEGLTSGNLRIRVTDACGYVGSSFESWTGPRIFTNPGFDCLPGGDGAFMNVIQSLTNDPQCPAGSKPVWEMTSFPITDTIRPPQDSGFFPNLEDGIYCFKVTDCCGTISTTCRATTVPTWRQRLSFNYSRCDTNQVRFFASFSFSGSAPQGYTSVLTSAPAGYTGIIPDTAHSTIIGPRGIYCFHAFDDCEEKKDTCYNIDPPIFEADLDIDIIPGCVTGNQLDITLNKTGGSFRYQLYYLTSPAYLGLHTSSNSFNNLSTGDYRINFYDTRGACEISNDTFTIPDYTPPEITGAFGIECDVGAAIVTVTGSGGNTPYTYELLQNNVPVRPLQSSPTFSGLPTGQSYDVRLNDNCNNSATTTVSIEPFEPTLKGYGGGTFCAEDTVVLVVDSLGIANYTWSGPNGFTSTNSSITFDGITAADAGNYSINIDVPQPNQSACVDTTLNFSISVVDCSCTIGAFAATMVDCNNAANGTATANMNSASGGPFTYIWSNSANTQTINNLGPGTYSVTITDAVGCTATGDTTITQPLSPVTLTGTVSNILCNGDVGSIDITPAGGTITGPTCTGYSYNWSNSTSTEDLNNLGPGTYTITVTDCNGCTVIETYTITEPAALTISGMASDVTCNGAANGGIDITVMGGVMCANLGTDLFISEYIEGSSNNKCIEIFNGTGAPVNLSTYSIGRYSNGSSSSIDFNFPFVMLANNDVFVVCNVGSTATFLNKSDTTSGIMSYNGDDAIVLKNNNVNIDIFGNIGCDPGLSWSSGGNVTVNMTLVRNASVLAGISMDNTTSCPFPTLSTEWTATSLDDASGLGNHTFGSMVGYNYLWSNGAVTEDLTGLSGGIYMVTVSDCNGCTITGSYTISEATALTCSVASTNVNCAGGADGTATASVLGGTPPYSYLWNTGAVTSGIVNLSAGTYTVTITDANSCTTTCSATLTAPATGIVSIASNITNIVCNGEDTGAATYQTSGGSPPYTLDWSNGQQDLNVMPNIQITNSSLSAGTYFITITDSNGCTLLKSFTLTENPALLAAVSNIMDPLCFGESTGQATYTPSGGVPPYNYTWDSGESTMTATGLSAGFNFTTVSDALGCSKTYSLFLGQPPLLNCSAFSLPATCNGSSDGSVSTNVSGGTLNPGSMDYQYMWNTGQTTASLSNLTAGMYMVTVTDDNGCTTTCAATVFEPDSLIISLAGSNLLCNNDNSGSIDMTVTGGNDCNANVCTAYADTLSANPTQCASATSTTNISAILYGNSVVPAGFDIIFFLTSGNGLITESVDTIPSFDVGTGNYRIHTFVYDPGTFDLTSITFGVTTFFDINSTLVQGGGSVCAALDTGAQFQVLSCFNKTSPNESEIAKSEKKLETHNKLTIKSILDRNSSFANNKSAKVDLSQSNNLLNQYSNLYNQRGGSNFGNNDTYLWSNGATTEDITGLSAGTYTVTVTDCRGCVATDAITITEPDSLMGMPMGTNLLCNGDSTGNIDLVVSGGTTPYNYIWSNGAMTEDISGLAAGTYTVTVGDANRCSTTASVILTEPGILSALAIGSNLLCFEDATGSINLTVTGGTPAYNYNWSNGETVEDITGLAAGTYMVTVTDANGCIATMSTMLTEPPLLTVTATTTEVTCYGGSDGTAASTVTGGTPAYSYNWSNGETTKNITGLVAGTYTLTVTDANECSATTSVMVVEPPEYSCDMMVVANATCNGYADGIATAGATGGTPGYTYQWDAGAYNQNTQTASGLGAGTYSVTVTDSNGCPLVCTATITEPSKIEVIVDVSDVSCFSSSDGSASVSASGGVPGYTYQWDAATGSQTTVTATGLVPGTYSVSVTDMNGCCHISSVVVEEGDCEPCELAENGVIDICTILAANPNDPLATLDCDNGGVMNGVECAEGNNPLDASDDCAAAESASLDICILINGDPNHPLASGDCDNGGVTNIDECISGENPFEPSDDCQTALDEGLNICALINFDPNHPLASLDCDNGGVANYTECSNGGDPSDSGDDCEIAIAADMDLCAIIGGDASHPWANLDCDNGGVDNITECNSGLDPSDPLDDIPCDPCTEAENNGVDICVIIANQPNHPLANLDCDNGGIDNVTECVNGGDPLDPNDDCDIAEQATNNFCLFIFAYPDNPLATADCDNGGVSNIQECQSGEDPFDPADDCKAAIDEGLSICFMIGGNPAHPLATKDCDNGGVDNLTECTNGGDPADPADDCQMAIDANIDICAMIGGDPSHPWASLDCDNGGIINIVECNSGENPSDPADDCQTVIDENMDLCALINADPNHPLATADCDNGGAMNIKECYHGQDPLDPTDDCQTILDAGMDICAVIGYDINHPLATQDCDNGGIINIVECNNGADPNDPADDNTCNSINPCDGLDGTEDICAMLTSDPSNPLATADCDNGGVDNATECANGGDPWNASDDCDMAIASGVDICIIIAGNQNHPLATQDCDEGGVNNLDECVTGEDPLDPLDDCNAAIQNDNVDLCDILINPDGSYHPLATLDCDNGGVPNINECLFGYNPEDASDECEAALGCGLDICVLIDGDPNHPLADLDCDNGGIPNFMECSNGGNPHDSSDDCQVAVDNDIDVCAIICGDENHPLASQDCDNGGMPNHVECTAGSDPNDPADDCEAVVETNVDICTLIALDPLSPFVNQDCDNGGISNAVECANGGNPSDPLDDCSIAVATGEDICAIINGDAGHPLATQDCDNGGVDNLTECSNGTDPGMAFDDCMAAKGGGLDVCALIGFDSSHPLATQDCDNGGVDNFTECRNSGDPCDPVDDCGAAVAAGMDLCAVIGNDPSHPWASLDCDRGGVDNLVECVAGNDPSDPIDDQSCPVDLCAQAINNNIDICALLIADPSNAIGSLDCDGGGVMNAVECANSGDPMTASDDCTVAATAQLDICTMIGTNPAHPLASLDCDGGGVMNGVECATGENPFDASDDCTAAIDANLNICQLINFDPSHPMASLDCDNGGVDNITECNAGGDPSDPSDDLSNICITATDSNFDICALLSADPTHLIGAADCDNGGVTNSEECLNGNDPSNGLDDCTDLTPITTILPGNIAGMSGVGVAVEITELNGIDTDGSAILIRIPSDPRLTFVWDPALTSVALTPVNNANWTYLGDNGIVHTFKFNGTGLVITGGETEAFGFQSTYDPQATDGQTTITASIVPFGGGECNVLNDTDSERMVYFE